LVQGGFPAGTKYNGTTAADTITGTSGADTFDMPSDGFVVDTITGGAGNDLYFLTSHEDTINEAAGGGFDVMLGYGNMTIRNGVEVLRSRADYWTHVAGNAENNLLIGTAAGLRFDGGAGADVMIGGAFADDFSGGWINNSNEPNIIDRVVLLGAYSEYARSVSGGTTSFTRAGVADAVSLVEKVHFSDGVFDVATATFAAYSWTGAQVADLSDGQITQAYLDLGTVFTAANAGNALFIDGDAGDIIAVQTHALVKYNAAMVRNGSTYDHYAYGTNHIFIEQGLVLTNGPNGTAPAGAPPAALSEAFEGQRSGYFTGDRLDAEQPLFPAGGRDISMQGEFLV
jgi:Ca2+-binding RTX toxin-like protein